MWALVESGTVSRVYNGMPSKITVSNRNYDQKQLNSMTATERKAVGIVPVTTSGSHLDARFYTEKNEVFALAEDGNSVIRTIGEKAADRKLTDTNNVDENGDPILDDHDNQIVTLGLKSQAKLKADTIAHGMIKGFGWLMQRKVSSDKAIPSAITTYMAAIRTDHKAICDAIDGASDMDAFIALHNDTYDSDGKVDVVARVNRWTDDYEIKKYRR
jgi:hypothetical protein